MFVIKLKKSLKKESKMTPPSRTLRSLSLASVLSHSDNRRICGLLTLAQISPYGKTSHIPITNEERDERIINDCIEYNAILLTGDKSMKAFAGGKNVFTIYL